MEINKGKLLSIILSTLTNLSRVRYTVSSIEPLNYAAEANKLAEKLKEFGLMTEDNSLFV
jgi:hypothetical protein